MNPEQVRKAIVEAAIPLIAQWDTVTPAQIAREAGIDEAALLSAFPDKDAAFIGIMQELMRMALDPTQVVQDIDAIPPDQPIAARLAEAIAALDAYQHRIANYLAPLKMPGKPGTRTFDPDEVGRTGSRLDVICEAVTKLLEPHQQDLRLPAADLADAFVGLYAGRVRRLPAEQVVDLFLHGAQGGRRA